MDFLLARLRTIEELEQAAMATGFMAPSSRLRERWRRLFSRVPAMEREEVNIMRGLLKALMSKWNS